jgi:hypothetical protein
MSTKSQRQLGWSAWYLLILGVLAFYLGSTLDGIYWLAVIGLCAIAAGVTLAARWFIRRHS